MADPQTHLFFPLRTSVELFTDARAPTAEVRAKQGAILFDRVTFEGGALSVTLTDGGSWQEWAPATGLDDAALEQTRRIHESGEPFVLAVGVQPAKGVPASPEKMRTMIAAPISRHYVAEWESTLRALRTLKPEWASEYVIPDHELARSAAGREIAKHNFACLGADLLPDDSEAMRDFVYKSFNRDAVIAEDLGATMNVTSLFFPMVERHALEPIAAGGTALEMFAPSLAAVPWDRVVEFREHPGCAEARERLREFEVAALDSEPGSLAELKTRVGQAITQDFQQAFQDMRPKIGVELVRQSFQQGVSTLVPIAGPLAAGIETGRDALKHHRSWRTALMTLTPPA